MIKLKTEQEIEILREGGRRHAQILNKLAVLCVPGSKSSDINEVCYQLCQELDVKPAFLNYLPEGASYPFPASLCFSINEEIVHGLPNAEEKVLQSGDIVTLDLGIIYKGLITDAAITVGVGEISKEDSNLLQVTKASLMAGIKAAMPGRPVSEIGRAIEWKVKNSGKYSIYKGLVGHGVGYEVHEEPNVPNFDTREIYPKLPIGAVIAIEPMIGLGSSKFVLLDDEWTYATFDGSKSAHFEHTVAITADGPLILTTE